jgi:hypothetical protein
MCLCMQECVYECICPCVYVRMFVFMYTRMHICMCVLSEACKAGICHFLSKLYLADSQVVPRPEGVPQRYPSWKGVSLSWIEYMWGNVSSRLQKRSDLSPRNFEVAIQHEWETIPYYAHCAVFNSIPNKRLRECIAIFEGTTHYKGKSRVLDRLVCKTTQS